MEKQRNGIIGQAKPDILSRENKEAAAKVPLILFKQEYVQPDEATQFL